MTAPAPTADPALREVVRAAASLLPRVDAVVRRCRTEPDPGQELARACGMLMTAFGDLLEDLRAAASGPLTDRVDAALRFEQRLVHEASRLAFRPHTDGWWRVAARFGDGLTDTADELLYLAARL